MRKKRFFLFVSILLSAFLSHAQESGLYPLTQYSVGGTTPNVQLRTTAITQNDTLKIPYIEDFSGPGIPIDSISIDELSTTPSVLVYRATFLKMHGLKSGDSILIYNSTGGTVTSAAVNGKKYVNVIDKYSFQLFNNDSLSLPVPVLTSRMSYFNWHRVGYKGYSSVPDTLGFLANNGGVFINNDMALNPVSIGVATFDGVDYRGIPYSTNTTKGNGDNLTSLPFNLSMYQPKDSVYMSFYWQLKGLGDSPLLKEFLYLEFKDTSGTWKEVWKQEGGLETYDTFNIAVVAIRDSAYLHKGFQYRFRSYGVINGRLCVWNLDYIYINSKRDPAHPQLKDVSIITTHRNALKNYTSIPYKHVQNLSIATLTDETGDASMRIRDQLNIYPSPTNPEYAVERHHLIRDNLGNSIKSFKEPVPFNGQISTVFVQPLKDTIPRDDIDAPYALKEEFYCQPLDTLDRIDLTFNNFTAIETYFTDYYSYDDGIPEDAFLSISPGGTKVANEYKILASDDLTHIDYCFIRHTGVDMTNAVIYLNVWKKDPASTENAVKLQVLTHQQIAVRYSSTINGFVRYALNTPLKLDAGETYYFGYTQIALNPLFLGYDRNNNNLNKISFSNNGTTWQPFSLNTTTTGSLMIRPIFSKNEVITSVTDTYTEENQFTFYPNPAKSELHFTGQPEYISVYDLSGLLILEKHVEDGEALSVEKISNGLYLMILSKGNYKEVKRLIIQK